MRVKAAAIGCFFVDAIGMDHDHDPSEYRIVAFTRDKRITATLHVAPYSPSIRRSAIVHRINGMPVHFDPSTESVLFDLGRRDPELLKAFHQQVQTLSALLRLKAEIAPRNPVND